jgi:hypothetical protein
MERLSITFPVWEKMEVANAKIKSANDIFFIGEDLCCFEILVNVWKDIKKIFFLQIAQIFADLICILFAPLPP